MLIFSYRRTKLSSRLWNAANSAYGYYVDVHEKPEKGGERFEHGDVLYRGTIRETAQASEFRSCTYCLIETRFQNQA